MGPDQRIQFLLVSVVGLAKVTWAFSLTGGMGEVWGSVLNQNTWLLVSSFLFLLVQGLGTVAAFLGQPGRLARACSVRCCQPFSKAQFCS